LRGAGSSNLAHRYHAVRERLAALIGNVWMVSNGGPLTTEGGARLGRDWRSASAGGDLTDPRRL